jgi:hypothetical protein
LEISRDRIKAAFSNGWNSLRRRTRKVLISLPYILLSAGVILCVVSAVRIHQIKDSQKSQIAAELWAGDSGTRYRQITCFAIGQEQADGKPDLYLSSAASLKMDEIKTIHDSLDTTVKAAAGRKEAAGSQSKTSTVSDDGKLWIDAYSSEATCTVVKEQTELMPSTSAEVTLTGVAGDYYLFHPMKLISGAFLSDDTLDPKKIVIDKELAFKLFGYYDAAGQEVTINQREYTIVGVVQLDSTKIDKKTTGDLMHAYVLFDELAYLSAGDADTGIAGSANSGTAVTNTNTDTQDSADPSNLAVTCYEAVLPDKIDGIAMQNLKSAMEAAGKVNKNFLFVDNTSRFSLLRLYNTLFPIGQTAMERQKYELPYWERSAQMAESVSTFWWIIEIAGVLSVLSSGIAFYQAKRPVRQRVPD